VQPRSVALREQEQVTREDPIPAVALRGAQQPGGGVERADDPDEATVLAAEMDNEPTTITTIRHVALQHEMREMMMERDPLTVRAAPAVGPNRHRKVGKYELRDKLGRGAFGVVYTARDPNLDRDVAIKVLRPTHLTNPTIVARFLQEARATARISHPGIVTIHDCGQVETSLGLTAFIAMELLTGESLTARLLRSGGRFPADVAIEVVRQVASALEAAHRADVLHRDLKPDNIHLVPDPAMHNGERVKVLDFGLAKLGHDGPTQLQNIFGTPRYMSPEQCRSTALVDHRSDIYSLGCILFELVTGQLPFNGDVREVIEQHQCTRPARAMTLAPEIPPVLDQLIDDMLAKDPMERPQTMGAVQRALQAAGGRRSDSAPGLLPQPQFAAASSPTVLPLAPADGPLPDLPASETAEVPPEAVVEAIAIASAPAPVLESPPMSLFPDPAPGAPMFGDAAMSGEIIVPAGASPKAKKGGKAKNDGESRKPSASQSWAGLHAKAIGLFVLLTIVAAALTFWLRTR